MEKNNIQTAEDYELLYDLHTHTTYSHGKGSIEDNVREAFNQGLEFVAISDHGPGHLFYGINREVSEDARQTERGGQYHKKR